MALYQPWRSMLADVTRHWLQQPAAGICAGYLNRPNSERWVRLRRRGGKRPLPIHVGGRRKEVPRLLRTSTLTKRSGFFSDPGRRPWLTLFWLRPPPLATWPTHLAWSEPALSFVPRPTSLASGPAIVA
jgi:hypothetical protein